MAASNFFAVILTLLVASSFEMLLCSATPIFIWRMPGQRGGVVPSSTLPGGNDRTDGNSEKEKGTSSPRSIRRHEQGTQLPEIMESIIDIGGNASSELQSEAFPSQAAELIFSLLKEHVASVQHPLVHEPPVFFTFDDRIEKHMAEGGILDLIDSMTGRINITFDTKLDWSGFSMHMRGLDARAIPVQIHFASETLAMSVFQQVYRGHGALSWEESNQLANDILRLSMVLDFNEGVVYLKLGDEELPLLSVSDVVRAYLMKPKKNTKDIPFQKLSLSVVKAPCEACLGNEAVDEYVRLSKSMIMMMHKRRSEFRGGNVLQYCWWKLKRAWKRIIRQKFPSLPMKSLSKNLENELYTWTRRTIAPRQPPAEWTMFRATGVLFVPGNKLIVYSDGNYHKFSYKTPLPPMLQRRDTVLVRRAELKITIVKPKPLEKREPLLIKRHNSEEDARQ